MGGPCQRECGPSLPSSVGMVGWLHQPAETGTERSWIGWTTLTRVELCSDLAEGVREKRPGFILSNKRI